MGDPRVHVEIVADGSAAAAQLAGVAEHTQDLAAQIDRLSLAQLIYASDSGIDWAEEDDQERGMYLRNADAILAAGWRPPAPVHTVAHLIGRTYPELPACPTCGAPVRTTNYAMGPEVEHYDPAAGFPTRAKGTAWQQCRIGRLARMPEEGR